MADADTEAVDPNAPVAGHGLLHAPRVPGAAVPGGAALRRRAHGRQAHRSPVPEVRARVRAAAGLLPDRRHRDDRRRRGAARATAARSPTTRSSRRCSTTARRRRSRSRRCRSSSTSRVARLSLQDVLDVRVDDVRVGMRVEAVWAPRRRSATSTRSATAAGGAPRARSAGWRPTGEPDLPRRAVPAGGVR